VSAGKLAKEAAEAVIGLSAYNLYVDNGTKPGYGFQNVFTQRFNSEYIFQFMSPTGNYDLERLFQPPSRTGQNGAFPLQGLVDAFPMSNGKAITDPTSGYDPQKPYPTAIRAWIIPLSAIKHQFKIGSRQGYHL
jgi:hypothetical protein